VFIQPLAFQSFERITVLRGILNDFDVKVGWRASP